RRIHNRSLTRCSHCLPPTTVGFKVPPSTRTRAGWSSFSISRQESTQEDWNRKCDPSCERITSPRLMLTCCRRDRATRNAGSMSGETFVQRQERVSHNQPGASPQECDCEGNQALKARVSSGGDFSIPD